MPGLLIKDVLSRLRRRLKEMAVRHHRSMTREALALLEEALQTMGQEREFPPAFKGRFPLTSGFVQAAKRQGRP